MTAQLYQIGQREALINHARHRVWVVPGEYTQLVKPARCFLGLQVNREDEKYKAYAVVVRLYKDAVKEKKFYLPDGQLVSVQSITGFQIFVRCVGIHFDREYRPKKILIDLAWNDPQYKWAYQ